MTRTEELLALAAKAAGIDYSLRGQVPTRFDGKDFIVWNPLEHDGDALRLAVKLRIIVTFSAATGRYCVIGCQRLGPDSIEEEGNDSPIDESQSLGDLEALQGVVKFPVRIKCAVLSWNTLLDALNNA